MDLFANDRSIHHQFQDLSLFREAILRLADMRRVARRWGQEVYCSREMAQVEPVRDVPMPKAIQRLSHPEKNAVMSWLTRAGPFWDDFDRHGRDEWLECDSDVVTDSAVAEAAFRSIHGFPSGLISADPSAWTRSPVRVTWRVNDDTVRQAVDIENWWDQTALLAALENAAPHPTSWDELYRVATRRFSRLFFCKDCFDPLKGLPFASGAAGHLGVLLGILDRFAGCFDEGGRRTSEGHRLVEQYFTGDSALFSDSSDSEKRQFRRQLTFRDESLPGGRTICGWHGKMKRHTIRFHFSWPVRANERISVVYVGPKLTKS